MDRRNVKSSPTSRRSCRQCLWSVRCVILGTHLAVVRGYDPQTIFPNAFTDGGNVYLSPEELGKHLNLGFSPNDETCRQS